MPSAEFDPHCRACPRLAGFLDEVNASIRITHARPVAPFGDTAPWLLIVGLAPGMHGANRSGRPFTGDHAGILLYDTLHAYGFASQPDVSERRRWLAVARLPYHQRGEMPAAGQQAGKRRDSPVQSLYLRSEIAALPSDLASLHWARSRMTRCSWRWG